MSLQAPIIKYAILIVVELSRRVFHAIEQNVRGGLDLVFGPQSRRGAFIFASISASPVSPTARILFVPFDLSEPMPQKSQPADFPPRLEIKENVRLRTVIMPRITKIIAVIVMAIGPLFFVAALLIVWDEHGSLDNLQENLGSDVILLLQALVLICGGFGIWILRRSDQSVQHIEENYTYSFALTPEGVFFPESHQGQKFIEWQNLIKIRTLVAYSKYRGAPCNFHIEFHHSGSAEPLVEGVPITYLPGDELKQAVAYCEAFAPEGFAVDRVIGWFES